MKRQTKKIFSNEVQKKTGKVCRETNYFNIPAIDVDDSYVVTQYGDRLDLLAHQYYKNRDYWWVIAAANNLGKGTLYIQEGAIIRIPINPAEIEDNITQNSQGY